LRQAAGRRKLGKGRIRTSLHERFGRQQDAQEQHQVRNGTYSSKSRTRNSIRCKMENQVQHKGRLEREAGTRFSKSVLVKGKYSSNRWTMKIR
jgi:hypothetical protein